MFRTTSNKTVANRAMTNFVSRIFPIGLAIFVGSFHTLAQLNDSWTTTVNGQTIQVNPDGSFRIPNISAPDQFGPEGPGSRPDFLSDDFVRLTGSSTKDGVTRYVF